MNTKPETVLQRLLRNAVIYITGIDKILLSNIKICSMTTRFDIAEKLTETYNRKSIYLNCVHLDRDI